MMGRIKDSEVYIGVLFLYGWKMEKGHEREHGSTP